MNRPIRYAIGLILLGFVAYNSVYFRRLDTVKGAANATAFDAGQYAQTFWTTKLLPAASTSAVDLAVLLPLLKTNPDKAFSDHAHAMGIGNIGYFLVKGEGEVTTVDENTVSVRLATGETVQLATEYVFSNAARDASGLIKITEFDNTTDLNNVSAALNQIIREQVVPGVKKQAVSGQKLRFVGAMELNQAHVHLEKLNLIPIYANRQ